MSESLRKASAWLGFSDLNQGGVSWGEEVLPPQLLGWLCPGACSPSALVKDVTFSVLETVWALVWEEQLRMSVLPWEGSLGAGQVKVMEVLVPIVNGMMQPAPPN